MIYFNNSGMLSGTTTNLPQCEANKTVNVWFISSNIAATSGWFNSVNRTTGIGYQLGTRASNLCVWSYGGTILVQSALSSSSNLRMATYVYNGSQNKLYLDGNLIAVSTVVPQSGALNECQMGNNSWNESMVGYLDDLRIYNRSLSDNEIQTLYALHGRDSLISGLASRMLFRESNSGNCSTTKSEDRTIQLTCSSTIYPTYVNTVLLYNRQRYV